MSLKNVSSSLLKQIGFSEEEQQVYFTVLGIGNASLGEIYLQTGIPFEDLQTIVDELHGRGYFKKIEGKINRYLAVEPFLKGFLFVEKEFQNDIIGIENSLINVFDTSYMKLTNQMEQFKDSISPIYDRISDELKTSNERLKMDLTNSIYRHSDKISNLAEEFDLLLTDGFSKIYLSINNELDSLSNEISVILREESDSATTRLQKFEQLVNNTIHDMIQPLDNALIEFNATVPEKVNIILDDYKEEVSTLQKNVKAITKTSLKDFGTSIKDFEKEYFDIITNSMNVYSDVIKNYKTTSHTLVDTEKKKIDDAVVKLVQFVGKNIDQLAIESANLKENIDEITKTGLLKRPDPQLVEEAKKRADKIDSISQSIKENYSDALGAYQKDIMEGLVALLKANDDMLSKQLKEGQDQIKDLKDKYSANWNQLAKKFDTDLNDAVKDLLKDSNSKITTASKEAFDIIKRHIDELKENQSKTLVPLKDVVFTDLEECLENLFLNSSKRLRLHNDSNAKVLETIRYLIDDMKFAFKSQVQEELSKPKMIASEMITEYTGTLDNYLTTLDRDQTATLDQITNAAEAFLTTLKDSYTSSGSEISNRLAAIIYKVNETKTYLQEITNSVDQIIPVARPHSIIVYGNQNSLNTIYDMLLRTKSTCTIVVPTIDEYLAELLVKQVSKRVRVRVLADIDQFRDEALVTSLKSQGNISVWAYQMRDFYAVTRDGAEVLLAPLTREGELTSFVTEQDALVRAVQQIINASFMARSREL
ncbi:MAG: helix-turn-helix domain-containing protein [Candidatus Thorarchaeota archaeon]